MAATMPGMVGPPNGCMAQSSRMAQGLEEKWQVTQFNSSGLNGSPSAQGPSASGHGRMDGPGMQQEDHAERIRLAQIQARYEVQMKAKDQELKELQQRLSREEVERAQMQAEFERDKQGLIHNLNQLSHEVAAGKERSRTQEKSVSEKRLHKNLDARGEQAKSLSSQEAKALGSEGNQRGGIRSALSGRQGAGGSSSSHRPRVTFPDDQEPELSAEVQKAMSKLERKAGSSIDAQARQILQTLGSDIARQAVQRAEELLQAQGGKCNNLSSMLQSVCRKLKRRENAEASKGHPLTETPGSSQGFSEKRASPRPLQPTPPGNTLWSTSRFDRHARTSSGFDLKEQAGPDGTTWSLRVRMNELNPPLNDEGMQVFCRWLHQTLVRAKEEHGIRSLRLVRTEVSFNWNSMGDDAVGRLLQALQRSELRVTSLSFSGNCLGQQGAAHVCEFIREVPFCVHEVNLSSNLLEDMPALDLLRLFTDHPRYPARRGAAGKASDAVRLSLGSNDIPHPAKVLRRLEERPGIAVKLSGRQSARECIVTKQGMPVLILPGFDVQEDVDVNGDAEYDRGFSAYSRPSIGSKEIWRPPPEPRATAQTLGQKKQSAISARPRPEIARPVLAGQPGVPEETPEPDASTPAKLKAKKEDAEQRLRHTPPHRKPISEENERHEETPQKQPQRPPAAEHEDEAEELSLASAVSKTTRENNESAPPSPPEKPVRLTAPPRILQRPSPGTAKPGVTDNPAEAAN